MHKSAPRNVYLRVGKEIERVGARYWAGTTQMIKFIKFIVPGEPKAQGRPRFARMGNFVRAYDPKVSGDFKSRIAFFAKESGVISTDEAVTLQIDVYVKRPKARCRKSDSTIRLPCSKRPDVDNYAKAVMDALTGIAWKDDGQIQELTVRKYYHEIGLSPRTEISVY